MWGPRSEQSPLAWFFASASAVTVLPSPGGRITSGAGGDATAGAALPASTPTAATATATPMRFGLPATRLLGVNVKRRRRPRGAARRRAGSGPRGAQREHDLDDGLPHRVHARSRQPAEAVPQAVTGIPPVDEIHS